MGTDGRYRGTTMTCTKVQVQARERERERQHTYLVPDGVSEDRSRVPGLLHSDLCHRGQSIVTGKEKQK
jgi:hypothetical protein